MKLKALLALAAMALAAPVAAQDKPPLTVEVLRTSAGSLHSNAALIEGEHDAVLVDPPFTKADAHRVAAMVLDSGKTPDDTSSSPTTTPTTISRWTCSPRPFPTRRSSPTRSWWPTSGARCRSR